MVTVRRVLARLTGLLRAVDLADLALVAGLALLWIGLGMVAPPLPYIVVGALLLAFGAFPVVAALTGRRR